MLQQQNIEMDFDHQQVLNNKHSMPDNAQLQELKFKLNYLLQTTLDINTMIELFQEWIDTEVTHCNVCYRHKDLGIEVLVGNTETHSYSYNLLLGQERLGTVQFTRATRFLEAEIRLLEELLSLLMYPLRNALKYHYAVAAAMRDPLTNVGNRQAFENALCEEFEHARRYNTMLAMLVLDLDHFKQINDKYGHGGGDKYLQDAVKTISDSLRLSDRLFRVGGEEFVVLLRETGADGSQLLAERIRDNIANLNCQHKDREIKTTVSIGVSILTNNDDSNSFIDRTDQALYQAKENGRNQVRFLQVPQTVA